MVLGVCRRIVQNDHDAEDACQAAFLVLVRQAADIRNSEALGGWLQRVAYHIALKARANTSRWGAREVARDELCPSDTLTEVSWREAMAHSRRGVEPTAQQLPFADRALLSRRPDAGGSRPPARLEPGNAARSAGTRAPLFARATASPRGQSPGSPPGSCSGAECRLGGGAGDFGSRADQGRPTLCTGTTAGRGHLGPGRGPRGRSHSSHVGDQNEDRFDPGAYPGCPGCQCGHRVLSERIRRTREGSARGSRRRGR